MRKMIRYAVKPLCLLLIVSFALLDLSVHSARAGMIGTEALLDGRANQDARLRVAAFLARDDVRQAMVEHGVNPVEANARVVSLSDAEVARVAAELDRLPAGADGVGAVIGATVFIFIVLLITDILGLTKIFPFTRSVR